MLLKIVEVGDPVLREQARPLLPEEVRSAQIAALIELMRETMRDAPGVGLAAPQIGESVQLAVIEDRTDYQASQADEELAARGRAPVPFHVIINPRLEVVEAGPAVFAEGCLSVPGFLAEVPRALSVRVEALDHRGQPVTINAQGWYARILQHEIDHLNGTLYLDRMNTRTFSSMREHARGPSRLSQSARVIR
jgi:peptide deformylase